MLGKRVLKLLPYLVTISIGGAFYFFSNSFNKKFYDLFVNISATFFTVPLLYFFYEVVKHFSHKRLNKEIFDYAKMQVDRELLSILNQLQKTVLTIEEKNFSIEGINKFLTLEKEDLESQLRNEKYLGFQIFKHWRISEKGLDMLLKNPFILEKMEDEQIISIISIIKSLDALEELRATFELYTETGQASNDYKIKSGMEINPENKNFPDRYLLLKYLDQDKFKVCDFGDISKYNLDKCLKYFIFNDKFVSYYAEIVYSLLSAINSWLDVTGSEFIVDTKMFKIRNLRIN